MSLYLYTENSGRDKDTGHSSYIKSTFSTSLLLGHASPKVRTLCYIPTNFVTALDKLGTRHLFNNSPPEPVQPNTAFDIASLVLYGCQALPIRLKILLDRLFSVLQKEQVTQVLHGFGWTLEDYARGYIFSVSVFRKIFLLI